MPRLRRFQQNIRHLLQVPRIGKLTSFTIDLEIDGIERFRSDKHLASHCRLILAADNSNRHLHHRSGKDGNKYLKIAFSEAAVHAIQYYPEFLAFYQHISRRSSQATSRTVVAKELAKIVYCILRNNAPYRRFKGQSTRQNACGLVSRQKSQQWPRLPGSHS